MTVGIPVLGQYPRMDARVLHGQSPRRIRHEQPPHHILRLGRYVPPSTRLESHQCRTVASSSCHGIQSHRLVIDVEWRRSTQKYVQYHPEAPHVGSGSVPSPSGDGVTSSEDLGGEVLGSATERLESVGRDGLGQAEVSQFDGDVVGAGDAQNVLGLQIPMNDVPILVQIMDGRQHPPHYPSALQFAVFALLHDTIEQIPPPQHLHDQIDR
mmetsp:Transcript_44720/g.136438  ORF Transcript_44720/g.136438 Transcript_44720/m.136438 type:complete len:211 (+) Transcript_44720:2497-3129(+)